MSRVVFDKVTVSAKRNLTCKVCGKKFTRQKTFWNTMNPWNKNPDGSIKTRSQVHEDVANEAKNWNPIPYCGAHIEEHPNWREPLSPKVGE